MVEHMRVTVRRERTRGRRRVIWLAVAVLLVAALDGVLVYLFTTAPAFLRAL